MLKIILLITLSICIAGCASSSDLEKSAKNHAKAGDYYEAIGQPQAAKEEDRLANTKRKDAIKADSILVELFNLLTSKK